MISKTSASRRQQGAILVTALIILVVMTLIGVTSMQSSTMEERMAGNMKEIHRSFQAAEAGMRRGVEAGAGNNVCRDDGEFVDANFTELYSSESAPNPDEVVPDYCFSVTAGPARRRMDTAGETDCDDSTPNPCYLESRIVTATGRAGTVTSSLRASYRDE